MSLVLLPLNQCPLGVLITYLRVDFWTFNDVIRFLVKFSLENLLRDASGDLIDSIFCVKTTCDKSHWLVLFFQLLIIFLKFWDHNSVVRRLKNSFTHLHKQIQRNIGMVFIEGKYWFKCSSDISIECDIFPLKRPRLY